MLRLLALCLCMFTLSAFSVDVTGTWKLNTKKSKYTGMPMPKEMTVTYTPEGSGWRYAAKGTSATGQRMESGFTYVKDGEEIKTTGFPNWDSIVVNNATSDKASGIMKRGGKEVGTLTRIISEDGKTMTIRGKATTPDGKPVSYVSVYERE